jgi:integrase
MARTEKGGPDMKPSSKSRYQRTRVSGLLRYKAKNGAVTYLTHVRREGANRWVAHGSDFALAQKRHHELMGQGSVAVSRLTMAEAYGLWRINCVPNRRCEKDQRNMAVRWRLHAEPILGHKLLAKLTSEDLRECARILAKGDLAPQSQKHVLGDVRSLLDWCVEFGHLGSSPFPKKIMPRIEERAPDRLLDDEVEAVLDIGEPHRFVVRLLLGTGLRWAEGCRSQRAHVEGDVLLVPRTKVGKVRRVPLVNPVADTSLLSDILKRVGRLVPYAEGYTSSFNKAVVRKSGVEGFHVHRLRHTFACRYLERGGSLVVLQQILGHSSIKMTERYAKVGDEHVQREARQLAESRRRLAG